MKALDRYLQRLRIAQVRPYVRSHMRVLDIGCADGAAYELLKPLATYVGIDPEAPDGRSEEGVRFIRSTFPCGQPELEGSFDVVAALAILEHIPEREQSKFASACASYLRPEGLLIVTVPSPAVDAILSVLKRMRWVDGMHEEQHYGYRPERTPDLFAGVLTLDRHTTFELGLNHLFVFRKPSARARRSPA